ANASRDIPDSPAAGLLKDLGYGGGYTTVTDSCATSVLPRRSGATRFASRPPPGEQAQVD
ncbi:hypothetical protein NKH42_31065, partial [Mesorhizobium sp. M1142]